MTGLQQVLKELQRYGTGAKIPVQAIERYLATGDPAALPQVAAAGQQSYPEWGWQLAAVIAAPPAMTDEDRRALQLLVAAQRWQAIGQWLDRALPQESPDEDYHAILRSELHGVPARTIAEETVQHTATLTHAGRPTSAGRYLLSLSDKDLEHLATKFADQFPGLRLLDLLLSHAPERVPPLVDELLQARPKNAYLPGVGEMLLRKGGERYERTVADMFHSLAQPWPKFHVGQELFAFNPTRYREEVLEVGQAALATEGNAAPHTVSAWLVEHFGTAVLDDLVAFLRNSPAHTWHKRHILASTVKALGRDAVPAVVAGVECSDSDVKLQALEYLIGFTNAGQDALIQAELARGLDGGLTGKAPEQQRNLFRYLALVARWQVRPFAEQLWALLLHKSKPARDTAARALAKLGAEALPRATELLAARRGDTRMAAVTILTTINSAEALAALEARLDVEPDENVRDAMLLGLDAAWAASGRTITRADIAARVQRAAPKLKVFPVSWLKEEELPPLCFRDDGPLDQQWVRYLLYRQSRTQHARADVEAKPLYDLVDRQRSGDFALAVLRGCLGSGLRWGITLAALLGDDRVVPLLAGRVRDWAEGTRGKLAEFGVQALALLGTDAALLTTDALAIRYRTKKKNVGQAAVDAFAAAAERLGITTDELGDRVVPWLGFEPGTQRIVDCGGRHFEVRIGMDCKLKYVDLEKKKPAAALPKSGPKEVLAALKEQTATLREVVKAQVLRLENLMVRQQRWPVRRWSELFLVHPVLLPFAVRLVWGAYDEAGNLMGTFRALEDRSLTDVEDNAFTPPQAGAVGIVHPLELSEDERQRWQAHLADYEVEPPFAQFERPVVRPKPEQRGQKVHKDLAGTSINALTFRGRAEKLGWHRGSAADGGSISSYVKSFPLANLAVFVELEGMYFGVGMNDEITLQNVYFVRTGSVRTGSYTYDEPRSEDDARLLAFGEVPAIVFSEAMGDLGKIAGQKVATPEGVAGG